MTLLSPLHAFLCLASLTSAFVPPPPLTTTTTYTMHETTHATTTTTTMIPFAVVRRAHRSSHSYSSSSTALQMSNKIGIYFGTSTGSTQSAAQLIADEFGPDVADGPIEIDGIQGKVKEEFTKYDALVVGTPTWNTGADTERSGTGWDEIYYSEMQDLDISGKKVAVFGLGDSVSYSENYADASGELHDVFEKLGCKMMGYTSQEGYEHEASKAIRGDLFCGLLLDAVNQEDLTEGRVKAWVEQLLSEGILDGEGAVATGGGGTESTIAASDIPTPPPPPPAEIEVTVASPVAAASSSAAISELEKENARLRKLLEENEQLLSKVGGAANDGVVGVSAAYTPHYNPRTGVTMWTSSDGRSCYYTSGAP